MDEKSKKVFLDYGNRFKKAVSSDNYVDAFQIVYDGIKHAEQENNSELAASFVSLVRAIYVIFDNKYRPTKDYKEETNEYCALCGSKIQKD